MGFSFPMANRMTFLDQLMRSATIMNCQGLNNSDLSRRRGIFLSTQHLCGCLSEEEQEEKAPPHFLVFILNKKDFKILPWIVVILKPIDMAIPSINCVFIKSCSFSIPRFDCLGNLEQFFSHSGVVLSTELHKNEENSILFKQCIRKIFSFFSKKYSHLYIYIPKDFSKTWCIQSALSSYEFYGEAIVPLFKENLFEAHSMHKYACYRSEILGTTHLNKT